MKFPLEEADVDLLMRHAPPGTTREMVVAAMEVAQKLGVTPLVNLRIEPGAAICISRKLRLALERRDRARGRAILLGVAAVCLLALAWIVACVVRFWHGGAQ